MKRYAIFGGTFDPFTPAHQAIVNAVLGMKTKFGSNYINKLFVAPTIVNYHRPGKKPWLNSKDKVALICKALEDVPGERWDIWDYDLRKMELMKTAEGINHLDAGHRFIDTLLEFKLHVMEKGDEVYIVLGTDSYNDFSKWSCYTDILELAKLIVITGRDHKALKGTTLYGETGRCQIPEEFAEMSATAFREKYEKLENGYAAYVRDYFEKKDEVLLHTPIFDVTKGAAVKEANFLQPFRVKAPDWVMICAEKNGEYLVETQLRLGTMQPVQEFPCGMVEENEPPKCAAIRELAEECGIYVKNLDDMQFVGSMSPNPAFMTNRMHFFYVNLDKADWTDGDTKLDTHENITFTFIKKELFEEMVMACATADKEEKTYEPSMLVSAFKLIEWRKRIDNATRK